MFEISMRSNLAEIQRNLGAFAYKQVPFAAAQALTELAHMVAAAERAALSQVLDRPTPFTLASIGVQGARKDRLYAVVFVKDIAAAYLAPYEFGGLNKLNSRALIEPVNVTLNQYGNLPRRKLAQLKAKKGVFVGKVKTKAGEVDGVWQRVPPKKGAPGHLKLLLRFADAHQVKQHLNYRERARRIVAANFNRVFGRALGRAMATAR